MVFDIPGPMPGDLVVLALELREQLRRTLAEDIDQHIEATAMRHADDNLPRRGPPGALDQLIQQWDQAVRTLQRKALLADIAGMQVLLQATRSDQALQHVQTRLLWQLDLAMVQFDALLQPALLRGIGDVHVLEADGAAIGAVERRQQVLQHHPRRGAAKRTNVILAFQIHGVEPMKFRRQIGRARAWIQVQRVEVGRQVTTKPIGVDQLQYPGLLVGQVGVQAVAIASATKTMDLTQLQKLGDHRPVGLIVGDAPPHRVEGLPPLRVDAVRILQPVLVQGLDERRITAIEGGLFQVIPHRVTGRV